jgi:serine/threonine-protein kinase
MEAERWQKINDLFLSALEKKPEERTTFINTACGDDDDLRAEVESLLAAHDNAPTFIDEPVVEAATQLLGKEHARSMAGRRIGHYQIISLLGAGGMGEVYLARDRKLARQVAIKLLPLRFTLEPDRVARFQREAQAASALNHPNIITIHEIGDADQFHFIATEFIDGVTLRHRLGSAQLSVRESIDIAVQIASALATAHDAGIVHRDIKPENVMLRKDGIVKVLDFGLAKLTEQPTMLLDSPRVPVQTDTGVMLGTVHYMSPEQARALPADARTDVWSLGVVLYEMIAGERPFNGTTPSDVIAAILTTDPSPLSSQSEKVPDELARIVTKALRRDAAERYQTAADMLLDLRNLKRELEFTTRAEPRSASSIEYLAGGIKRHKLIALAVVAVIGISAMMLASYWYFARGDSLAVLPFTYVNTDAQVSADPDRDFFADGVTEDLINRLSHISDLRLIARNSVFRYKGKNADPQTVGRELGVRNVLMGQIVQRGDDLTISVELVDARNNSHLWGEQFDRKVTDLFSVQKEISRKISDRLGLRLTGRQLERAIQSYTPHPDAYQLYLKGRYFWNKRTPDDLQKAADYFQQAIAKDSSYAQAYSGLADTYYYMGYAFGRTPPREAMPRAKAAALKALELDENLAEAHTSLGLVKFVYDWDWAGAEIEFKRAIELNPNYASVYHFYSIYLICVPRRPNEAIAVAKQGLELDPLSIPINNILADHLGIAGRHDEAIEQRRKVLELDPNDASQYLLQSNSYAAKGMYDEAFAEQMRADAGVDREEEYRKLYKSSGWSAYLQKRMRDEQPGLVGRLDQPNHTNMDIALAFENYKALGENDKAFALLNRMYEERNGMLIWLNVDQSTPLRSDPRFNELLRRIGLPVTR